MANEPSRKDCEEIAAGLGLHFEREEVEAYRELVAGHLSALAVLDALPEELPRLRYPRLPGERPAAADNPLNAWYVRTHIQGATEGKLAGRSVVLKDNVMLAGVPMTNGTSILDGYVPPVDATIVDRILDAGATIVGKAVCEAYCLSAGSHTSATGPVLNPHDRRRSAGGSSSGSAALVAAGEVDMAIGCDQGGSIRVPSSFCGTVGMKPTHGLVPYTGILGFDPTIDHAGPITATVRDNALFLEVLAGPDGLDSRQGGVRVEPYTEALGRGIDGLRIGLLREGFGLPSAERDVDEKVREVARRFERLGARVSEVSVPFHLQGLVVSFACMQANLDVMLYTDGCPIGRDDPIVVSYLDYHRRWRERADELPATVKTTLLLVEHLRRRHGYRYYAMGVNQMRRLRVAYERAFAQVDLLLLPTTPMKAPPLPEAGAPLAEVIGAAFAPATNTSPFNGTHHPALSLPCGRSEGLPIGMMLVGRHGEESTIYRAADAFERHADWRSL